MMIKMSHLAVAAAAFISVTATQSHAALQLYYEELFNINPGGATTFELGELNEQNGWRSIPGTASVVQWGQANRRVGVATVSRGAAFGFETLVNSPVFANIPTPTGEDYVLTMLVAFDRNDVTWYVTPKNVSNNTVITRIKFAAGGGVFLLVPNGQGGGDFEPVPGMTWQANHNYTIVLAARADGRLQFSLDQRQVADFNGASFIQGIEAVSIETSNERSGRGMLFDKIKVRHGHLPN